MAGISYLAMKIRDTEKGEGETGRRGDEGKRREKMKEGRENK
jgi:hypothetical protein